MSHAILLATIANLEREVIRLRAENERLRKALGSTLTVGAYLAEHIALHVGAGATFGEASLLRWKEHVAEVQAQNARAFDEICNDGESHG